jgi:esterase/lipase
MKKNLFKHIKILFASFLILGVIVVALIYYFPEIDLQKYSFSDTVDDYETSKSLIQSGLKNDESEADPKLNSKIDPKCKSLFFDHQKKQEKVIVFFHGLTNCPAQFEGLGKAFFEAGYNVYIPRLYGHGYNDKMTNALEKISAENLIQDLENSYKIASGLGNNITFAGISGGAVLAAWGSYHLPKVNQAIIINPLFSPTTVEGWQVPAVQKILDWIPNIFLWWDDKNKEALTGPKYAYPRYSTKAIQAFLRLAIDLDQKLNSDKNKSDQNLNEKWDQNGKNIVFITLQDDPAVNNKVILGMAGKWANRPGVLVKTYQIPSSKGFIHDIIDPNQKGANPALIQPFLLKISEREEVVGM